ncbi:MAG: hypothetical protein K0Q77_3226, partial [Anaerosporomusa subterranea]|nr:hypothetical protein [Anaerosporomusa subterranea]
MLVLNKLQYAGTKVLVVCSLFSVQLK